MREPAPLFGCVGSFHLFMQFNPMEKLCFPENLPVLFTLGLAESNMREMGREVMFKRAQLTFQETPDIKTGSLLS